MTTEKGRAENLYRRLYVAGLDVGEAQQHARHLLKKGWHHEPWDARWSVYMQQIAFTTALIVGYGRAFTRSKGWPDIPDRLIPYNKEERQLHRELMDMRNTIYAHSDSSAYNIRLLPHGAPRSIDYLPSLRLSKEETELFMEMTAKLLERLGKRRDEVLESLGSGT
jgi:hypothetical protein